MTDSEKLQFLMERTSLIEEALKMILVNDVLKDAETLTGQKATISNKQDETQREIEKLQKATKAKDSEIEKLKAQIETQTGRIQTLQNLSESKDRTVKTKEERIKVLQKTIQSNEDMISTLQNQLQALQKSADNKGKSASTKNVSKINPSTTNNKQPTQSIANTFTGNIGKRCKVKIGKMFFADNGIERVNLDRYASWMIFEIIGFDKDSKCYLIESKNIDPSNKYWAAVSDVIIQ